MTFDHANIKDAMFSAVSLQNKSAVGAGLP